ncbi:Uncharacterised protein [Mycobacteroides abscessus]|nr:Uncharacterised protein [Mycobacteroides abscessus]
MWEDAAGELAHQKINEKLVRHLAVFYVASAVAQLQTLWTVTL